MKIVPAISLLVVLAAATTGLYQAVNHDRILYLDAVRLFKRDSYCEALPIFQKLAVKDFRKTDSLIYMGLSYEKQGNTRDSIRIFRQVLSLEPSNDDVRFKLGELYERDHEYRLAADMYGEIIKKKPANRAARVRRARALTAMGRFDEAIDIYREMLGERS